VKFIISIILFLFASGAFAQEVSQPTGEWFFKSSFLKKEVKIILNFAKKQVYIETESKKTEGPPMKIEQGLIEVDLGFGYDQFFLKNEKTNYYLCHKKNIKDCQKLTLVN
jgi:hypothetical protein